MVLKTWIPGFTLRCDRQVQTLSASDQNTHIYLSQSRANIHHAALKLPHQQSHGLFRSSNSSPKFLQTELSSEGLCWPGTLKFCPFACSVWSFPAATSYTNLYNVLNFPAGVVPVSTVTRADEEELKHYRGHYEDPWDKRLKEVSRESLSRRPRVAQWHHWHVVFSPSPDGICLLVCLPLTFCTLKRWHYTRCALTQHHA